MKTRLARVACKTQRGQSLVEVCVACIALVPLAIGLVYVGQYIHVKQTVQQAAREAAWDAASSPLIYEKKNPDGQGEIVRLRETYYGDPDAAIETSPTAPASFSDTVLEDYSGRQLLAPNHLTLAVYTNEQSPGPIGAISSIIGQASGLVSKIPGMRGGNFPPDPNGYLTARVDAQTTKAAVFAPYDKLDLNFHSQTVLLVDAWNADGAGESDAADAYINTSDQSPIPARTVVNSLPPSAAMLGGGFGTGLTKFFNFVGALPFIGDMVPTTGLNFGRAAPDVIPYDKLQPYNAKQ